MSEVLWLPSARDDLARLGIAADSAQRARIAEEERVDVVAVWAFAPRS